jgi:hypothetical protein
MSWYILRLLRGGAKTCRKVERSRPVPDARVCLLTLFPAIIAIPHMAIDTGSSDSDLPFERHNDLSVTAERCYDQNHNGIAGAVSIHCRSPAILLAKLIGSIEFILAKIWVRLCQYELRHLPGAI